MSLQEFPEIINADPNYDHVIEFFEEIDSDPNNKYTRHSFALVSQKFNGKKSNCWRM